MSKTEQFWQYAKEAIVSASRAKTDEDRQGLLELAQTWTQAALLKRASSVDRNGPGRGQHRVISRCAIKLPLLNAKVFKIVRLET